MLNINEMSKMYAYELDKYRVIISSFDIKKCRYSVILRKEFKDLNDAIEYAQDCVNKGYKVTIKRIENIIGWCD